MNTKTIYCSDMCFIRKLKQPLKQKVPFWLCVTWFLKTFPQYLTLYYYIIYIILLYMLLLQKPRDTEIF